MTRPDGPSTPVTGPPVASPLDDANPSPSMQATGSQRPVRGTNDFSSGSPGRRQAGKGGGQAVVRASRLAELETGLSERDWLVLRLLNQHSYLTTTQLQRFAFTGHASDLSAARTCRRVLARLERDGLLRAMPRRQGGVYGGSAPVTWQLAPAGARLVRPDGQKYRTHLPTLRYLHHCLSVGETHLGFRAVASATNATVDVTIEQQAWRRYPGLGGEALWLRPDLHVALSGTDADGSYEDRWFVEVDCGTESLPTLLRKCEQYEAYRQSGVEQAEHGVFPLVLWVFVGPRADSRNEALRRSIGRSTRFAPALYRYATAGTLRAVIGGAS